MSILSPPASEILLHMSFRDCPTFLQIVSGLIDEYSQCVLRLPHHEREAVLGVLRELSQFGFIDIQRMPYTFEKIDETGENARRMITDIEAAWPPTADCHSTVGFVFEVGPTKKGVAHAMEEYNRRQRES